jgi:hypothetical protein
MEVPKIVEQNNVELIGYHELEGKPGFKMGVQVVGDQWYLYVANLWHSGWTILNVTDPGAPRFENFIQGTSNTWTIQIQIANGKMITALEKPVEGWGVAPNLKYEEGAYIWDIAKQPIQPQLLGHYKTGGTGTHRNYYANGNYVYMAANKPGFLGGILTIVDISDPANPREVSQWWLPEQKLEAGEELKSGFYFHGPAYVHHDRAYLSYGIAGMIILDISDKAAPRFVSRVSFGNLGSALGCHTAVPIPEKKLVIVNSEPLKEEDGDRLNYTFVIDVSDEENPRIISSFPLPVPTPGLPYANYYQKGGRFGPHNQHHYQDQEVLLKTNELIYMTYFNAGLRIFDIKDPFMPKEVGCFVPENPNHRRGVLPSELVTQFEDVLVDARGYIYCTDKNHGLFILKYTGRGGAI